MIDPKLLKQIAETQFQQRRADDWEYKAGQRLNALIGIVAVLTINLLYWAATA